MTLTSPTAKPVPYSVDWQHYGACAAPDVDPDLFHAVEDEPPQHHVRRVRAAKAVCARCPVTAQCLAFVQETQPVACWDYGVFGGTSQSDRARLREGTPTVNHGGRLVGLDLAEARIVHARARVEGVRKVAEELGMTTSGLYRLWKRYGLAPPQQATQQRESVPA